MTEFGSEQPLVLLQSSRSSSALTLEITGREGGRRSL